MSLLLRPLGAALSIGREDLSPVFGSTYRAD
jgi:hypothetical protein